MRPAGRFSSAWACGGTPRLALPTPLLPRLRQPVRDPNGDEQAATLGRALALTNAFKKATDFFAGGRPSPFSPMSCNAEAGAGALPGFGSFMDAQLGRVLDALEHWD